MSYNCLDCGRHHRRPASASDKPKTRSGKIMRRLLHVRVRVHVQATLPDAVRRGVLPSAAAV